MRARKTRKVKDLVSDLQGQGISVKYRKRSDGGYLITSINGTKYKGATGNLVAREITGSRLTGKQTRQRRGAYAQSPIQFKKPIREAIKKAKSEYKKSSSDFFKSAKPDLRGIKADIEFMGQDRALESIENNIRRAQGYAYPANVDSLIAKIERGDTKNEFVDIIATLRSKRDSLPDHILPDLYQIVYEWEDPKKDVASFDATQRLRALLDTI